MALPMGSQAPDFTLSTLQGEIKQLSQLRGTPVLLNFFRTDCTWCTVEMPKLANAFRRHHDVAVHFLGVASDSDVTLIENVARDHQLYFPILHDMNGETMRAYSIERVPTFVVVD